MSLWWWWVERQNQERNLDWKDDIYAETWKVIMVQMLSCGWLFETPWSDSCPSSRWCHPAISSSARPLFPPSLFPSIKVFSNESGLCIKWPKYLSFSFSISPSNEYSGLISFRMDWLDLLAVQRTLKNFLQHHSSKASILRCSAFFIVQLSYPYMSTGKIIAYTKSYKYKLAK